MGARLPRNATTLNSKTTPQLKRRRQGDPTPDLPSPPTSTPSHERPLKKRKTQDKAHEDEAHEDETHEDEAHEDEAHEDEDIDPLRPPQFWDNLSSPIPLVRAAVAELNRRNNKAASPTPLVRAAVVELDRRNKKAVSSSAVAHWHRTGGDIQRYARQGGPDLSDIRAGGEMPSTRGGGRGGVARGARGARGATVRGGRRGKVQKPRSRTTHSSHSKSTKTSKDTTGPYDAAFKQHLINHQVWPIGHYLESGDQPPRPDNFDAIVDHVNSGRASLEPETFTQRDFDDFCKSYRLATTEEAQSRTLEFVEGRLLSLSSAHIKRGPVKLANLEPLTPDNFVPGNPDRIYGSRPEKLHRRIWMSELKSLILPTAAKDVACPNLVVHLKGPAGSIETANIQAVYDGALAARGMEAMWLFGNGDEAEEDPPSPPQHVARTLTCTFAGGVLRIYAVHLELADSSLHGANYVTTPIAAFLLDNTLAEFCRGAAAYRNAIEWARKEREEVIERANRRATERPSTASASSSFSSADQLA